MKVADIPGKQPHVAGSRPVVLQGFRLPILRFITELTWNSFKRLEGVASTCKAGP